MKCPCCETEIDIIGHMTDADVFRFLMRDNVMVQIQKISKKGFVDKTNKKTHRFFLDEMSSYKLIKKLRENRDGDY